MCGCLGLEPPRVPPNCRLNCSDASQSPATFPLCPGEISKSPVSTWESAWDHFNAKKHEDGCSSMYGTGQKWHGQWGYAPEALILSYFILTVVLKLASVHYFSFSILNMQALWPLDDARSVRFTLGISMYLHRKQKNPTPRFGPTLQLILA